MKDMGSERDLVPGGGWEQKHLELSGAVVPAEQEIRFAILSRWSKAVVA